MKGTEYRIEEELAADGRLALKIAKGILDENNFNNKTSRASSNAENLQITLASGLIMAIELRKLGLERIKNAKPNGIVGQPTKRARSRAA